ncbi:MAG: L-threonylcarbamoyladenylate synthase [Thermoguttaceae bacterium]
MPPVLIDVRAAEDPRDVVHQAVQALAEGKLVVFPTETVYGVAARALDAAAVERLLAVKGRKAGHPVALAIRSAEEARDWAPDMSPLAQRLARRCWPGPVTLVVDDSHPESLVHRLPPSVRRAVSPGQTVGLRVPEHRVIMEVLKMLVGPLILTSANRRGQPEARTAQQAAEALNDSVDVILEDGPTRYGQPSSVVRVSGKRYEVLRAGAVPEKTLRRLAGMMVLFVCAGNTCRSPMAEVLCRQMIAERLGCSIAELEERGVVVASAGLGAASGGRASQEAVQLVGKLGLDLTAHLTRPLSEALVRQADVIFTMGRSQREAIASQWPGAAERTQMLSTAGQEIPDPIGGPLERYERCLEQLQAELRARVNELDL